METFYFGILVSPFCWGQVGDSGSAVDNPIHDESLAQRLGGDEYGMKSYFLVILQTGPDSTADQKLITESFRGHLENIGRLAEEGKLIVAGPLAQNRKNYRGIFILDNIGTMEEVNDLLLSDPAIENKLLDYEVFTWYGSAALPEYLPVSDKIWKKQP